MEEFETAIKEVKDIEKKALKQVPYTGEINIEEKLLDLSPSDYIDIDYGGLLNLYERAEKIIKASAMLRKRLGVAEAPVKPVTVEKDVKEVEERLKKIAEEAVEAAEKMRAAPPLPGEEIPEEEKRLAEIEIERKPVEMEVEKRKPPVKEPEAIEFEEEREVPSFAQPPPEKLIEERPKRIEVEAPVEVEIEKEAITPEEVELKRRVRERAPVPSRPEAAEMPSILEGPPEEAEDTYQQIEKEVVGTVGEQADDATIKKKMLELTKELFKEKITSQRERIKLEITVLKNILAGRKKGIPRGAGAKVRGKKRTDAIAHAQLLETITSTQKAELAQTKDAVINNYRSQINPVKAKFAKEMGESATSEDKKEAYDGMVFELTKLTEQAPALLSRYRDQLKKKHLAEMANIEKNLTDKEKETQKRVTERRKEIGNYERQFSVVNDILNKEVDAIIRSAGREVFRKEAKIKTEVDIEEEKVDDIIAEIEGIDDGTLMYYLHSNDPEYYKNYERKNISKAEALSRAKVLMAKEKGLKDASIKKYFGNVEG